MGPGLAHEVLGVAGDRHDVKAPLHEDVHDPLPHEGLVLTHDDS
jgi:hypothetical protein